MSTITAPAPERTYRSETSKHRDVLAAYCIGYGIDVGFGGDPITPSALRMDLPQPYARTGENPVQLGGDCRNLHWFRDDVLDYVYSSHVLEDFDRDETGPILREWARVLGVGGHLVLLLPDQKRYVAWCRAHGEKPNAHHSIEDFSLEYVRAAAERVGGLEVVAEHPQIDQYSFAVVFRKTAASNRDAAELQDLRAKLAEVSVQRHDLAAVVRRLQERVAGMERSRVFRAVRVVKRVVGRAMMVFMMGMAGGVCLLGGAI